MQADAEVCADVRGDIRDHDVDADGETAQQIADEEAREQCEIAELGPLYQLIVTGAAADEIAQAIAKRPHLTPLALRHLHRSRGNAFAMQVATALDAYTEEERELLADDAAAGVGDAQAAQGTDAPIACEVGEDLATEACVASPDRLAAIDAQQPLTPHEELARTAMRGQLAIDYLSEIQTSFMPVYRRAVDNLDSAGAHEAAILILAGLAQINPIYQDAKRLTEAGPQYVSGPDDDPAGDGSAIIIEFIKVTMAFAHLAWRIPFTENLLAERLGPTLFRGDAVLGANTSAPLGKAGFHLAHLQGEAATTIALIETVNTILGIAPDAKPGACSLLDDDQRQAIVAEIAPWKSRPINFAFLRHVLGEFCIWQEIEETRDASGSGPSVREMEEKSLANAERFGAFSDIGEYDEDEAFRLLTPEGRGVESSDPATQNEVDMSDADAFVTTGESKAVYEKLVTAPPEVRAQLIVRLDQAGRLGVFCSELPWKWVEALADSLYGNGGEHSRDAISLLRPHYENKGGGKSMRQYEESIPYVGGAVAFLHDVATAGANSEISDLQEARNAGLISDEEYWDGTMLAASKAMVMTVAGGALGSAGGAVGGKVAGRLGAGGLGQFFGTATAAGAAGAVGGHFSGDVFAQLFQGKEGFDSLESYATSAGIGAGVGFAAASFSTLATMRYLPYDKQPPAVRFANAHPEEAAAIEAIANGQPGSRIRIRVPKRRAFKLADLGIIELDGGVAAIRGGTNVGGAGAAADELVITLDLTIAANAASWTGPGSAMAMARLSDEVDPYADPPDHGGGGQSLSGKDRDVLGDGAEVDALYVEEAIPEPSRFPRESEDMGWWEGQRGHSPFHSHKDEVIAITGGKPIRFVKGEPDFTPWSQGEVKIVGKGNMTGTDADFDVADEIFARLNPDRFVDARAVAKFRKSNRLTWHHKMDMETLQLVPTDLNAGYNIPHIGGAALSRTPQP